MKFDLRLPPKLSRLTKPELAAFNDWSDKLALTLKRFFTNIEDDNIKSVSADKLTGSIDIAKTPIKGGVLTVTEDGFRLASEDGGQYIELMGGVINIKANIINE